MSMICRRMGLIARGSLALVFVALLLGSLTDHASAQTSVTREETQSAHLTTSAASLEIISPGKLGGVTACLSEGAEMGCADVAGTFVLADDLSSAALAPTAVDLYATVCEGKSCDYVYTRTVTVEATWVAVGAGQRVHERLDGSSDSCIVEATITGHFQPATGTLIVDGTAGEGTGDLQALADVTRRTCR